MMLLSIIREYYDWKMAGDILYMNLPWVQLLKGPSHRLPLHCIRQVSLLLRHPINTESPSLFIHPFRGFFGSTHPITARNGIEAIILLTALCFCTRVLHLIPGIKSFVAIRAGFETDHVFARLKKEKYWKLKKQIVKNYSIMHMQTALDYSQAL